MVKRVLLAGVRGPCAGVSRALSAAESALGAYAQVYALHEPVHNSYVVDRLVARGMVLVDNIEHIPKGSVLLLSAHGTDVRLVDRARTLGLVIVDAACPLVLKVHSEVCRYRNSGRKVIIIGNKNHVEIMGLMGHFLSDEEFCVISGVDDIQSIPFDKNEPVSYVTQTTLNVVDVCSVVDSLKVEFADIVGLGVRDVCFATHNRQGAVRVLCDLADAVLVIGSQHSSNSKNLADVVNRRGKLAYLSDDLPDLARDEWDKIKVLGLTAGASAPDILIDNAIEKLRLLYPDLVVDTIEGVVEDVKFAPVSLPVLA